MGIKFNLEPNLQQMALIQVAANIWLSHPMITRISNFIRKNKIELKFLSYCVFQRKMRKWLIDIFEQVDSMKLPDVIKNDLLYVMRPVGENLLDYLVCALTKWDGLLKAKSCPGLDVFCKYIEFDYIGRVDEVKTFLNIYNANENVSISFLLYEACTYCLEDVIHSIWNKCSEQVKHNLEAGLSVSFEKNWQLIQRYWMQFIGGNQSMIPYKITEIEAHNYSVKKGNNVGVKYFINKLSQDDKNKIILPLAEDLLEDPYMTYTRDYSINPNRHTCDLLNSLLAHMTEDNKNKFFISNKKRTISLWIKEWPWKYLLLDLDYFDKETHDWLIKIIIETIFEDCNFYTKIVYSDLWIISEIWKKNPNHLKESIVEFCWSTKLRKFFKLQAVVLVTSVIDDTDGVNKLRPKICKGFEKHRDTLIDAQKYDVVNLYLKNVLQNDEERKSYKELLNSKDVCYILLISKQFKDFNKVLNWRFDNDHVQITQFKKYFTADTVIIAILCRMLGIYETRFEKPIGSLFLVLDLDRSYQEKLKQKLIKNFDFKAYLGKYIEEDPKHINQILSYFQFSSEEIVEIKKSFE